ncbi:MAG: hypothetical protein ACYC4Q_11680, partial [Victivallaceae bacterium]
MISGDIRLNSLPWTVFKIIRSAKGPDNTLSGPSAMVFMGKGGYMGKDIDILPDDYGDWLVSLKR